MSATSSPSFAQLLRSHRLYAGLSQADLAEKAGLSLRGVSDLERGARRAPYLDTVRRLADALQLSDSDRQVLLELSRHSQHSPKHAHLSADLPVPLSSLVGRASELATLQRHLHAQRLVTLTGPGGIGKTRLALEVAQRLAPEYSDGVAFADLSPSTAERILDTIGAAFGIREPGRRTLLETLADSLRLRHVLLVLDNCEHVLEASARTTAALLQSCPQLHILATSREPLGIGGELVWTVPPLGLPPDAAHTRIQDVVKTPAVGLLVERIRAVRPDYVPTDQDAADLTEIVGRVDGIPLAIELAAARSTALSISDIADRLRDPLRFLIGGDRSGSARQRTLRATLEWSYELLDSKPQTLFARLAVFVGGWTLDAAEAICADESLLHDQILDSLEQLVRGSLVVVEPHESTVRYRMLDTLRAFASERLHERSDAALTRNQHSAFFTAVAERAASALVGPDEAVWLARLEREHDNLRAALRWRIDQTDAMGAQRLAGSLYRFWFARGHFSEGRALLSEVLELAGEGQPSSDHATCWFGLDLLALAQGDWDSARSAAELARNEWQTLGRRGEESLALRQLGILELMRGRPAAALGFLEEGLRLARAVNDRVGEGLNLWGLAQVHAHRMEFEEANALAESALSCFAVVGWRRGALNVLAFLGDLRYQQGEYSLAQPLLEQTIAVARELGAEPLYCSTLVRLGQIAIETGDLVRARNLLQESLRSGTRFGDRECVMAGIAACAQLAAASGDWRRSLMLAGAMGALRSGPVSGGPTSVIRSRARESELSEHHMAAATSALGGAATSAALAQGAALTLDAAISEAFAACESRYSGEHPIAVPKGGRPDILPSGRRIAEQ